MPTLPSGRTLGFGRAVDYAQLVWREQHHIIHRAALELIDKPEDLYDGLAVVEKTADGADQPIGVTVSQLLAGKGDLSAADREAYAEWLRSPRVVDSLQGDLDQLHAALEQIAFRLDANVREIFPEDHAGEALLMLTKDAMANPERYAFLDPPPKDVDSGGAGVAQDVTIEGGRKGGRGGPIRGDD